MTKRFSWFRILAAAPLGALAGFLLSASWGLAQNPPPQRHHMENRFLFVIDTSSAMKARTNGVEEAVTGLLASGMKGQLRKGDTIGVWTYGDHLNTDFPRLVWSEQKKDEIVNETRLLVRGLHYEKKSHLDKALTEIGKVLAHSERLTVILIFDGVEPIKGTPFDKDINELHKLYAREFKTARSPFVTLLAAREGRIFDYTINYPNTVVVPHTADPLPPPETNAPPLVAVKPPPVISVPPMEPKPPQHNIEITLTGTNSARNASAPPPAASNSVAVVVPAPAPTPAVVSNAPPPVAVQPPNTNVALPASVSLPSPAASNVVAAVVPAPTPTPAVISNAPPPPVAVQPVNTNVTLPARVPPPAAASPPPASAVAAETQPPPVASPPPTPSATIPAAPAVVVPAPSSTGQQMALFVMAFSLLTIAVVLVVFLVRRSRGGSQPSLISQSIDRPR